MTPEAQRIAIAKSQRYEWSGSPRREQADVPLWGRIEDHYETVLPDYLHDLNVCHEMEKSLPENKLWAMTVELTTVVPSDKPIAHATAAQRCEAFLRTLNLWDDSK